MSAATLEFRKPVFRQCLNTVQQLFPERGRLLDVGCWTGDFVQAAAAAGWSAAGIELSAKAAHFATTRNLDVRCCTLSTSAFPSASFDVVTMLDVLEHVLDPLRDLERARSLLKVNGAIVVRVPNTVFHLPKTRICRCLGIADHGLQTRYHLNHFTPRTLGLVLQRAGFDRISLQVGAPELIAHAPWARPWAKRAYVRMASRLWAWTGLHVENITVAYARKRS
jgi:SAM-dependent methyltransferase